VFLCDSVAKLSVVNEIISVCFCVILWLIKNCCDSVAKLSVVNEIISVCFCVILWLNYSNQSA
jgi:hypothetical protein